MADTTISVSEKEKRLGGLSLICLALGVVGPFLILTGSGRIFPSVDPGLVALGFRGIFVVLALLLGVLGRRSRAGLMGLIGSGVLLAIVLLLTSYLFMQHSAVVARPATVPVINLPPPQR